MADSMAEGNAEVPAGSGQRTGMDPGEPATGETSKELLWAKFEIPIPFTTGLREVAEVLESRQQLREDGDDTSLSSTSERITLTLGGKSHSFTEADLFFLSSSIPGFRPELHEIFHLVHFIDHVARERRFLSKPIATPSPPEPSHDELLLQSLTRAGVRFAGIDKAKVLQIAGHSGLGPAVAYVLGMQIGTPRPMPGDADAAFRYDVTTLERLEQQSAGLEAAAAKKKCVLPPWVLEHGGILLADLALGAVLNHAAMHAFLTARLDDEARAALDTLWDQKPNEVTVVSSFPVRDGVKSYKLSNSMWKSAGSELMKTLELQPMPMFVFHGTTVRNLLSILQGIDASTGLDQKDFSCRRRTGFYTGPSYRLAREWADTMAATTGSLGVAVVIFDLSDASLDAAPVSRRIFETADEGWQQCVDSNRGARRRPTFPDNLGDSNMIEGPVARWNPGSRNWEPFNPVRWQHCWFEETKEFLNARLVGFCFHLNNHYVQQDAV